MVPREGLEPSRPCSHQILSLACLPIPSSGHIYNELVDFLSFHSSKWHNSLSFRTRTKWVVRNLYNELVDFSSLHSSKWHNSSSFRTRTKWVVRNLYNEYWISSRAARILDYVGTSLHSSKRHTLCIIVSGDLGILQPRIYRMQRW